MYISQSDKGELVLGAGTDSYNSYAQRGSVHIIEHQLAAACELYPIVSRLRVLRTWGGIRSEEHTSELQSLMRISYAVFCLKKKNKAMIYKFLHNSQIQIIT